MVHCIGTSPAGPSIILLFFRENVSYLMLIILKEVKVADMYLFKHKALAYLLLDIK